jgi:hypothetical protein
MATLDLQSMRLQHRQQSANVVQIFFAKLIERRAKGYSRECWECVTTLGATARARVLLPSAKRPSRRLCIRAVGVDSVFLAGEVEKHGDVFVAFTPGPRFCEVVRVVEAKNEMMLMPRGG